MIDKIKYLTFIQKGIEKLIYLKKSVDKINKSDEKKVFDFFTRNKPPIKDEDYHKFAESENMQPDEAEQIAYNLLSSLLSGGKSGGIVDFDIDKNELEMGMKIEQEHTNNILLARKIAIDHLKEDPKYYTKLKQAGL